MKGAGMRYSSDRFVEWATNQAFVASAAPYLVLDRELCIRAVNPAYERATLQPAAALLGCNVFDAFPDNPTTPESRSVANLTRSLETVLRRSRRDRMAVQRYDVPSPKRDGTFIRKVWSPTNSPLPDADGRTVGVLHHVEDVTASVGTSETDVNSCSVGELASALAREQRVTSALDIENANLNIALQTSRQIGMAIGIIMSRHKVTDATAFGMLREVSQCTHRRVRDIALDIIEQGGIDV
jgi:two-component system, response regulator / RNA-binding antiterminator